MSKFLPKHYYSFFGRLLKKWDWMVYSWAYHSLGRITLDNPGMSYLMELQVRKYNATLDISPELKSATEHFFNALEDMKDKNGK